MKTFICAAVLISLIIAPAQAAPKNADGLIVKPSQYSVGKTLDRLSRILKQKGITVFARVDHKAGGRKIGKNMDDTQVLIFGNPKLGTPLMQSARSIGIDLPMKALAWKDAEGKVWIAYNDPAYLAKRHGITDRKKIFKKMSGTLNKLTNKAAN